MADRILAECARIEAELVKLVGEQTANCEDTQEDVERLRHESTALSQQIHMYVLTDIHKAIRRSDVKLMPDVKRLIDERDALQEKVVSQEKQTQRLKKVLADLLDKQKHPLEAEATHQDPRDLEKLIGELDTLKQKIVSQDKEMQGMVVCCLCYMVLLCLQISVCLF
jgi:hypothetical protein